MPILRSFVHLLPKSRPLSTIMLPGLGEITNFPRSDMARFLAVKYGWSSIILPAPYYSERKPEHQTLFFQERMSDVRVSSRKTRHSRVTTCWRRTKTVWWTRRIYASALTVLVPGVDASRLVYVPLRPCTIRSAKSPTMAYWGESVAGRVCESIPMRVRTMFSKSAWKLL